MRFNKLLLFAVAILSMQQGYTQSTIAPVSTYTFSGKPQYQILTKRAGVLLGNINVELFPAIAPNHTKNFDSLVSTQFYDSTAFHRVIPGFMIQGGDPNSRSGPKSTWGYGNASQPTVNAEFSVASHQRGILSAARSANINSATSQFFICVAPATWLDGQYSIYGRVTSGMNIVDTIVSEPRDVNNNPIQKIEMFVTYTGSNDTLPTVPVLDLPLNNTQNVGTSKQLTWLKKSDDIIYQLQVSTDSLFSTFFKSINVGINSNLVTGLQGSTTYYWRVRSNNGGSWSAYSPVWNFSTTFNASVNNLSFIESGYRLDQNIPNPSSGETRIKYVVPSKEKIVITLFDISGRELSTLVNEEKGRGEYEVVLNMNTYSSGTYFYRMQAGELSDTKTIVLDK